MGILGRFIAAGAALGALAVGTLTAAPPASAWEPAGMDRCPKGDFCLFTGLDGTGSLTAYRSSQRDFGSAGRHAASWANRTADYSCLYPSAGYTATSAYYTTTPWGAGPAEGADYGWDDAREATANWRDHFGSVRLAPTGHECGDGHQYVDWGRPYDDPLGTPKPFGSFLDNGQSQALMRSVEGHLWVLPGGSDPRPVDLGGGWNAMTALVRHGDFTGDGREDVFARDRSGTLWLYPGLVTRLGTRIRIGGGWNAMTALAGVGDLTGDGRNDLVARDRSGTLWLYPGTGHGGLGPRRAVGSNWNTMSALTGPGDLNGDKHDDLVARDTSGRLWLYPGDGRGHYGTRLVLATGVPAGWRLFAVGDADGDLKNDLWAVDGWAFNLWSGQGNGTLRHSVLWEYGVGIDPRETFF
ncbi:FG-GAP-like repeat-containing protein [Streptomyces sp. HPF1205]|uniref:FG-GAP-like repeat-containing protein n=1 Tax=Streptomyces sp. HPF1205 TaxID=2873262 RepID=UPI001CECC877|nr:FG-GAP-like repeat-containing protein [Streptomyces sp. HPF1205]